MLKVSNYFLGSVPVQDEGGCERESAEGHQVPRHAGHVRHVQQGAPGQTQTNENKVCMSSILF